MPPAASEQLKDALRRGWLQQHYVKIVARVVDERDDERTAANQLVVGSNAFHPALTVESFPEAERTAVRELYASVDTAAASAIKAVVEEEFLPVASLVPASALASVKTEFRRSWLEQHYVKIISRVLNATSKTLADGGAWTFVPLVPLEVLPAEDRERAQKLYATMTRDNADERSHRRRIINGLLISPSLISVSHRNLHRL